MKITLDMIDPKYYEELEIFPDKYPEILKDVEGGIGIGGTSQYMEYPPKDGKRRFVLQHHWRGRSVHWDLRLEMNDHLVGWSILDNPPVDKDVETLEEARENLKKLDWKFNFEKKNIGLRAETKCKSKICDEWTYTLVSSDGQAVIVKEKENLSKITLEELARQPKDWLAVQGVVQPGKVGATKTKKGVFLIVEKGTFWEGAQKPYFHEYFLKSTIGNILPKNKWVRIIVRGIKVARIDPETKKPIPGKYELMWRLMIPKDQTAYALKRGMKKGWKPPKGIIPIPPDQRKGELWEKWKEYMGLEKKSELSKSRFTLHLNTYMGQVVIRAVPNIEYYLRLQVDGKVRSWYLDRNPFRIKEIAAVYEGRVSKKWLDFEGDLKPGERYNPTKTLIATMKIIDKGSADVQITKENGREIIRLNFNGKYLKGSFILEQEEKGSDIYVWRRLEKTSLVAGKFVLHRHYWNNKEHWDVRIKISKQPKELIEWNLWKNPLEVKVEEPIRTLVKRCRQPEKWFIEKGKGIRRLVAGLETFIDVLDSGQVTIIEAKEGFSSMKFEGNKLKGYWILKRDPETNNWFFVKSRLPEAHSLAGEPLAGDYYKPFLKEQRKGWDYYWLRLYDIRKFTRCELNYKDYLKDLKIPDYILDILVCLYPKPGTIHWARVAAVKVKGETELSRVINWIKKNKLHTWTQPMIKRERKKD